MGRLIDEVVMVLFNLHLHFDRLSTESTFQPSDRRLYHSNIINKSTVGLAATGRLSSLRTEEGIKAHSLRVTFYLEPCHEMYQRCN
jgi:hypothetical protein